MKILFTSDIHNSKTLEKEIKKEAENADMIVIAGDLVDYGGNFDLNLFEIDKDFYIIPGNNDPPEFIERLTEQYSNVHSIHKKRIDFGKFNLVGMGFATVGPYFISEDEYNEIEPLIDSNTILVTHEHPDGIDFIPGSVRLRDILENKELLLHIHGHIHELGGEQFIIGNNLSINVAKTVTLIDIDKWIENKEKFLNELKENQNETI